jgi:probable rRNA maturation factor
MSRPDVHALDRRAEEARARVPVDLSDLAGLLADVLSAEGVASRAEASLSLVDPDEMAALNVEHLGGEGPTDVLSFPIDGAGPVPDGEPWLVGDVVVCAEVAAAQAADHAGRFADELALLVVHGGLHLCGWDHADGAQQAAMWARERELLAAVRRSPSEDPWREGTSS